MGLFRVDSLVALLLLLSFVVGARMVQLVYGTLTERTEARGDRMGQWLRTFRRADFRSACKRIASY